MPQTDCGFTSGNLLVQLGPTLLVDIGFQAGWAIASGTIPTAGIKGVQALVDTGASECCIDNILATNLSLPVINRRPISGIGGSQMANMYLAQVYVPTLSHVVYGAFAGVDLVAGGQPHSVLMGRTFLQSFKLIYDGITGAVTISS